MTDEITQQSPAPAETAVPAAETPTLESIAKELSVTEQAQQFQSAVPQYQPQYQPVQQPAFRAPDPITDPEGYNRFLLQQNQTLSDLGATTKQIAERFQAIEQKEQEQRINHDVNNAVTQVNEKLKVDPKLAEVALEFVYRTDPNFKKIWDNRERNPEAYKRALDVVTEKTLIPMFNVRQDPTIASNIKAAKTSQQSMATTRQTGVNDGVPTDHAEFSRYWANLVNNRGM
jgi:hypothetical protein